MQATRFLRSSKLSSLDPVGGLGAEPEVETAIVDVLY
jgi:hypothetical protein